MRALLALSVLLPGCTMTLGFDGLSGGKANDADAGTPCVSPCKVVGELAPGSIGSGFTLDWKTLPEREVVGGFVEENQVILGVRIANSESIVMSVDVETG